VFTGGSSEKFRIAPDQVQIDTTHFRPQHHVKSAVSATNIAINRTAMETTNNACWRTTTSTHYLHNR